MKIKIETNPPAKRKIIGYKSVSIGDVWLFGGKEEFDVFFSVYGDIQPSKVSRETFKNRHDCYLPIHEGDLTLTITA